MSDVGAHHVIGLDRSHKTQKLVFVGTLKLCFQLVSCVKVIFNSALAAARDENHVSHAGRVGFFYGILNERFVDNRQHFFGCGFGRRQETRAQAGHWKDGF